MTRNPLLAATTAIGISAATLAHPAERIPDHQDIRNVVLVHGAFADGSGWRGVYDWSRGNGLS